MGIVDRLEQKYSFVANRTIQFAGNYLEISSKFVYFASSFDYYLFLLSGSSILDLEIVNLVQTLLCYRFTFASQINVNDSL